MTTNNILPGLMLATLFSSYIFSVDLLLDKSQKYLPGMDIVSDPIDSNEAIIHITASNVELDLRRVAISLASTSTQTSVDAIFIDPDLSDITIKNGSIRGTSGAGIYISDGCKDIRLENMIINECDEGGIVFDGSLTGTGVSSCCVDKCTVTECNGTSTVDAVGLKIIKGTNIRTSKCTFSDNNAGSIRSGYGVYMSSCSSCKLKDVKMSSNGGDLLACGLYMAASSGCSVADCSASSNASVDTSGTGTGCGMYLDQCHYTEMDECTAGGNTNADGYGIGFYVNNGTNNGFIDSFGFANIGDVQAVGYLFKNENKSAIYRGGSTSNNGGAGIGYGVLFDGAIQCMAWDVLLAANVGGSGYGFFDTTTNPNNLLIGCSTYANTTAGFSITQNDGNPLPVLTAGVRDFTNIQNISKYMNVAIG